MISKFHLTVKTETAVADGDVTHPHLEYSSQSQAPSEVRAFRLGRHSRRAGIFATPDSVAVEPDFLDEKIIRAGN